MIAIDGATGYPWIGGSGGIGPCDDNAGLKRVRSAGHGAAGTESLCADAARWAARGIALGATLSFPR